MLKSAGMRQTSLESSENHKSLNDGIEELFFSPKYQAVKEYEVTTGAGKKYFFETVWLESLNTKRLIPSALV